MIAARSIKGSKHFGSVPHEKMVASHFEFAGENACISMNLVAVRTPQGGFPKFLSHKRPAPLSIAGKKGLCHSYDGGITMIKVFCLLIVTLVALPAVGIGAEKPCSPDVEIHKEKDVKALEMVVQNALLKADQRKLKGLIACDFMIAKNESDVGGFRRGISVIPQLVKIFNNAKFKTKHEDYGSQINLETEGPYAGPALVFRKDDISGWYWAGIGLTDSKKLAKLLKGSYRLSSSDQD